MAENDIPVTDSSNNQSDEIFQLREEVIQSYSESRASDETLKLLRDYVRKCYQEGVTVNESDFGYSDPKLSDAIAKETAALLKAKPPPPALLLSETSPKVPIRLRCSAANSLMRRRIW